MREDKGKSSVVEGVPEKKQWALSYEQKKIQDLDQHTSYSIWDRRDKYIKD